MAELPQEPSNRQLLERIVRLEAENSRLRARVDDVQEGLDIFMAGTVGEVARVNDLLLPVVNKVFPKFSEMKSRMDAIIPPCCTDPRADRQRDEKPD